MAEFMFESVAQPHDFVPILYADVFRSGSIFKGYKIALMNSYEVQVDFENIDELNSIVSGVISMKGVTASNSTLRSFFRGEIISKKYPFLTRKWGISKEIDQQMWGMFPYFKHYEHMLDDPEFFEYFILKYNDIIFMRWKHEYYLSDYEDDRFDRFKSNSPVEDEPSSVYYVIFNKRRSTIQGYFYESGKSFYDEILVTFLKNPISDEK